MSFNLKLNSACEMKLYVVQNQLVFLSAPLPQSDEDDFLFMVDFCSEFPDGEDDAVHLGINSEKKVIRVTPGLTYCKSFPQEEYRTFLWNRITDRFAYHAVWIIRKKYLKVRLLLIIYYLHNVCADQT